MSVLLRTGASHRANSYPAEATLKNAMYVDPQSLSGEVAEASAGKFVTGDPFLPLDLDLPDFLQPNNPDWRGPLAQQLCAESEARNWRQLADIAKAYLTGNEITQARDLDNISAAAIGLFDPLNGPPTASEVVRFLEFQSPDRLRRYFEKDFWPLFARLGNIAVARQSLGMLGGGKFDVIAAIRALSAFLAAMLQYEGDRSREEGFNIALIEKILAAHVVLPSWSFKANPCDDPGDDLASMRGHTPLEKMLDALGPGPAPGETPTLPVECKTELPSEPLSPCCPEIRCFVTDLLELRDYTKCYIAGDLAHIEVVAAGETLKRKHKMTRTREVFSEERTSARSSERRDHQVTERFKLQREIDRQIKKSLDLDATATAKGKLFGFETSITTSVSFNQSSSQATRRAQEQAREIVTQSVSEIEKETKTLRSESLTTEEMEKNVHTFDNASGEAPKITKYFYVIQRQCAELFNYGKRLTVDVIIPQPSSLYETLIELRRKAAIYEQLPEPELEEPIKPDELDFGFQDIDAANYLDHAAAYDVQAPPAPPDKTKIHAEPVIGKVVNKKNPPASIQLSIPPDYVAVKMTTDLDGKVNYKSFRPLKVKFFLGFSLAGNYVEHVKIGTHITFTTLPSLKGNYTITGSGLGVKSYSGSLIFNLEIKGSVWKAWQQSVFELIKQNYDSQLALYEETIGAYEEVWAEYRDKKLTLEEELKIAEQHRHPFYNREIEQAELKRAIIHLLCREFSKDGALYNAAPCDYPEIDRVKARELGDEWYFWERLFDWDRMAYAFFDYFWNPLCDWPDKFDPDHPDALFKAFLRAGFARVLIAVNPEMVLAFLWYKATGQIWGPSGEPPIDASDPQWRDVLYEINRANDSALSARTGYVSNVAQGDTTITIKGTDLYWDPVANAPDQDAFKQDVGREMYIDCEVYRVAAIIIDPASPPYDPLNPDTMCWSITLDRPYEGQDAPRRLFSMGAKAVAPAFTFELPTDLIWAGHAGDCLPCYPLPPCEDPPREDPTNPATNLPN